MAKRKKQDDEVLVDVGEKVSGIEKYVEENKQTLSIVIGAIFVIVGGYFGYMKFYQEPLEEEALNEIYQAQRYFEQDSLKLAVNGDGQNLGFLDVAAEYGGTEAGNLANYYAGVSYLNLGQYENAIRLLDEFKSNDPVMGVVSKGSIGDAFMELDQPKEALDYYDQAVSGEETEFVVPFYLKKAGLTAEMLDRYDDAQEYFERIKKEFPDSPQGADIKKYLARVENKAKKQ